MWAFRSSACSSFATPWSFEIIYYFSPKNQILGERYQGISGHPKTGPWERRQGRGEHPGLLGRVISLFFRFHARVVKEASRCLLIFTHEAFQLQGEWHLSQSDSKVERASLGLWSSRVSDNPSNFTLLGLTHMTIGTGTCLPHGLGSTEHDCINQDSPVKQNQ